MAQALSELYTAKDDLRQRKETGKRKRDNQEESESRPGGAPPRSFHLEKVGRQRDELRRQIEEHDSTHSAELSQVLASSSGVMLEINARSEMGKVDSQALRVSSFLSPT
eukprot:gb/GEZN01007455.1/.p3 GENE.gb/GEZN01007455.1/~~gb/GEZN01007455.1/.p3  ORF type:complete len:109 (+),score=10.36 gb/GEZN01007455.1/:846-1172(+)